MLFRKKNLDLSPRLKLGVGRLSLRNQVLKISGVFCLILAIFLTVNAITLITKNSGTSPKPQGEILGITDVKMEFMEYEVKKGDTLFNLSQKFNLSWVTLANLNNLKSPFTLKPGQKIQIPKH
jgi:LysM repeat protein